MTEVIPAPVVDGRRLDWFPRFDEQSRAYAARPGVLELPTRGRLWKPGRVLDQGNEGACCGFAAAAEAAAEPVPVSRVTNAYARGWYRNAQRRDEWQGEAYDGTSVLATMKEGKARGAYGRYGWFFTPEQLAHGIVADAGDDGGPAVIGVEWRQGSYGTDQLGVLRPFGDVVGGHALCVLGFVLDTWGREEDPELWAQLDALNLSAAVHSVLEGQPAAFVLQNSWGTSYGRGGLFVVPLSVMRAWFDARGEFAQPQQRQLPGRRKGTAVPDLNEDEPEDVEPEQDETGDETLHIPATDVRDGDRILDPPDELGQESVTVRGTPQRVTDFRGRRVMVNSTAGMFTLSVWDSVTVRRANAD